MEGTKKFSKLIITYVENCEPKLALFDNVSKGEAWLANFMLHNQNVDPNGTYIDSVFKKGELIYTNLEIAVDESDYCGE